MTAAARPRRVGLDRRTALRINRVILWMLLPTLVTVGVVGAIRANAAASTAKAATAAAQAAADRPVTYDPRHAVQAFAVDCARRWFTYNPDGDSHAAAVDGCAAGNVEPSISGDAAQTVLAATVSRVDPVSDTSTIVTVDVTIAQAEQTATRRVNVPVVTRDGGYAVAAQPTYAPPLPHDSTAVGYGNVDHDDQLTAGLSDALAGFFAAYGDGQGSELAYYTAEGSDVTLRGLDGQVTFDRLSDVAVSTPLDDDAGRRRVVAAVVWRDGPLDVAQQYAVVVSRIESRWYVESVDAATPPPQGE